MPQIAAILALVFTMFAPPSSPQSASAELGCSDGVTVLVDFTDLGGDVLTGCADGDPVSGREALESSGFTAADSSPGLICTIDAQPDPCPTEFDGNFWSYWQFIDGEWVSSSLGADDTDPAPGDIDGWRYSDGTMPPPLPEEVTSATDAVSGDATAGEAEPGPGGEGSASEPAPQETDAEQTLMDSTTGRIIAALAGAGVLVAIVVAMVVRMRRSRP
ncbi:MAG: hypothetical protein ACK5KU_02220 [Beutenbergiaceae bacterium]